MTPMLSLLATAGRLNPLDLFLQADIVVKLVMAGLLIASVMVWTIIFSFWRRMSRAKAQSSAFEREFWEASDSERMVKRRGTSEIPSARVANAALKEWALCRRRRARCRGRPPKAGGDDGRPGGNRGR